MLDFHIWVFAKGEILIGDYKIREFATRAQKLYSVPESENKVVF